VKEIVKEGNAAGLFGGSLTFQRELDRKVELSRRIAAQAFLPELSEALDLAQSYAQVLGPNVLEVLVNIVLLVDQDHRTEATSRLQRVAGREMILALARIYRDQVGGFEVASRMFDLYVAGAEDPHNFVILICLANRFIYYGRTRPGTDGVEEEARTWESLIASR
jgi:hypothetical protein